MRINTGKFDVFINLNSPGHNDSNYIAWIEKIESLHKDLERQLIGQDGINEIIDKLKGVRYQMRDNEHYTYEINRFIRALKA